MKTKHPFFKDCEYMEESREFLAGVRAGRESTEHLLNNSELKDYNDIIEKACDDVNVPLYIQDAPIADDAASDLHSIFGMGVTVGVLDVMEENNIQELCVKEFWEL